MDIDTNTDRAARLNEAHTLMLAFARDTGLEPQSDRPRRYLWTDAFAVCTLFTLAKAFDAPQLAQLALRLIDQVHQVLGHFAPQDTRSGPLSGLDAEQARLHPTLGGLRIGKKELERGPHEPYDAQREWDRDGQYFHYLTKWMHALERAAVHTGDETYLRYAVELAQTAFAAFTVGAKDAGPVRMVWKMSVDLTRPLVPSMGQHDPLDALVTFSELRFCAHTRFANTALPDLEHFPKSGNRFSDKEVRLNKQVERGFDSIKTENALDEQISTAALMCEDMALDTTDPLGLGGLLFDAVRSVQMSVHERFDWPGLTPALLAAATRGIPAFLAQNALHAPASVRLAFRELGLAIGLHGEPAMRTALEAHPQDFANAAQLRQQLEDLQHFLPLARTLEDFWMHPQNRTAPSWSEHQDINTVTLATALAPDDFLTI